VSDAGPVEAFCHNCGCRLVLPRWWILAGHRFCHDCERCYREAPGYADWFDADRPGERP
jgi:hypothetical protein